MSCPRDCTPATSPSVLPLEGAALSSQVGVLMSIAQPLELATNSHSIIFDNLSTMPAWLCDELCRVITGSQPSTP